jgi:hypothetical protein
MRGSSLSLTASLLAAAAAAAAQSAPAGSIVGTVFDSTTMAPLAAA